MKFNLYNSVSQKANLIYIAKKRNLFLCQLKLLKVLWQHKYVLLGFSNIHQAIIYVTGRDMTVTQ